MDTGIIVKNQNRKYNFKNGIFSKILWIEKFTLHKRRFELSIHRLKKNYKLRINMALKPILGTGINRLRTETENKIQNEI